MSDEIVPIVLAGGNTKPPPKQQNPKKRYCLTLNNWTEKEYFQIKEFISANSSNKGIIGKEMGELKTPHLQIFISMSKKIRFTALKKLNNRLHIEESRGSDIENAKYCSKDGDYWTFNLKVPKPITCLKYEELFKFQQQIIKKLEEEPNDREILWIIGKKNIGKSKLLKYICMNMGGGILPTSKKHALSQVHSTHEAVDIFCFNLTADESEYQCNGFFSVMEAIKDELFASSFGTETNGMCITSTKHILVVANKAPDFTKTEIDRNRFNIYNIVNNQLMKIIEESESDEEESD